MKKLATKLLVALGLLTSGGVMAQTLTNEAVTATWAFELGTAGQLAVMTDGSDKDVTSDYFKGSNVALKGPIGINPKNGTMTITASIAINNASKVRFFVFLLFICFLHCHLHTQYDVNIILPAEY